MKAGGWTLVQALSFRALQLGSNLILTRLLFPEAFGLMALVTVFVGGLSMISDVGIRPALIRSARAEEPVFQSTTWSLQIVRGLVLTALAWVLAWPYAALYGADILVPLIATMAISTTLAGFASIEIVLHERKLTIARVALMHIGAKLLGVMATVALAWWLGSIWALVWGGLVTAAVKTAVSHFLFPSKNHRLSWNRDVLAEILLFGRWVMLGTLLTYLGGQGLRAIQGVLVDLETLAFLAIAGQLAGLIVGLATTGLKGVVFPALAEVHRDQPETFPRRAVQAHRAVLVAGVPLCFLLSVLAEPLVGVLYDARYAMVGPFLTLLALNSALALVPMTFARMFLALGDSRTYSLVAGISAALQIGGAVAGFMAGGVTGMLVGLGLGTTLGGAVIFRAARHHGVSDQATAVPATLLIYGTYALTLIGQS